MIKTLLALSVFAFATPAIAADPQTDVPEIRMQTDDPDEPAPTSTFVDQTRFHEPEANRAGNCVQAAIASILSVPLDFVPDITDGVLCETPEEVRGFWSRFDAVFEGFGLATVRMVGDYAFPGLHLAAGLSPRGTMHMVLREGFDVVHDPHPSRAGLTQVTHVYIVAPRDMSQWTMREAYPGAGFANAEGYKSETPSEARGRAKRDVNQMLRVLADHKASLS